MFLFDARTFRSLRKEKCLTQRDFAEQHIATERYLTALETGKRHNPSLEFLIKSSFVLHEPIEKLLLLPDESEHPLACTLCSKCTCCFSHLHLSCSLYALLISNAKALD